jgi:uncharacterized membrane protein
MQLDQIKNNDLANDQVYKETRWVSALIIPFLLVAFYVLYFYPDKSNELFAWAVFPRMTAMLLASGYIAGAYFFSRAAVTSRWHWIERGFLPGIVFGILMALATILHSDAFDNNNLAFLAWSVLNLTVPILVFVTWMYNRISDPGRNDENDILMSYKIREIFALIGLAALVISALLFFHPEFMAGSGSQPGLLWGQR